MKAQVIVSAIFFYIFILQLSLERKNLYLINNYKMFSYILCYYKYTAKNVDDENIYL